MRNLVLTGLLVLALAGTGLAADTPPGNPYSSISYMEGKFVAITITQPLIGGNGETANVTYTAGSLTTTGAPPKLYVDGKPVTANELAAWSFARIGTRVHICENGNLYFSGGTLWQQRTTVAPPTCPNGNCPRR